MGKRERMVRQAKVEAAEGAGQLGRRRRSVGVEGARAAAAAVGLAAVDLPAGAVLPYSASNQA